MSRRLALSQKLAAAFLNGFWSLDSTVRHGAEVWGSKPRWLRPLARRVLAAFPEGSERPDQDALADFLQHDRGFSRALQGQAEELGLPRVVSIRGSARMTPAPGAPASWTVPSLVTPGALADWLGLQPQQLDWFADYQGREAEAPPGPLRHYTYRWLTKRSGSLRLLEMPKARLKALQRRLLHEVLDHIPAHDCAHGYRRRRSLATYTAPHAGQAIVLRFDLRDFFPCIRRERVHALFRTAGYPAAVARLLTGLCTNVVPGDVCTGTPDAATVGRLLYSSPHLPQGAPTSPALANLCAFRLDCRLAGLAHSLGANYTRYADDLAFSGGSELERGARRFQVLVCRIALEEGFEVHTRKSRFMRQGVRQQLAGVVLNVHPNVRRDDYDRLKAVLWNCVHQGPQSQNRAGHVDFRAHLAGRIAHITQINPARGRKLRDLFERICWGTP